MNTTMRTASTRSEITAAVGVGRAVALDDVGVALGRMFDRLGHEHDLSRSQISLKMDISVGLRPLPAAATCCRLRLGITSEP
jgi:hypothetical protein